MIELNSVKLFAEQNKELYTAFKDYRDQWLSENRGVKGKAFSAKSLDDKANVINKLFAEELERKVPRDGVDLAHYANSPMVKYFSDTIVDSMIDMVIPDILNTSVGLIADIKYLDYGDSAKFDMKNNGLFTVAKAGYRQRNTIAQPKDAKLLVEIGDKVVGTQTPIARIGGVEEESLETPEEETLEQ